MMKISNDGTTVEGFILELYRHGHDVPCYVSGFDPKAEAGLNGHSEDRAKAVVFESREALLPLAAIEVEAVMLNEKEDEEYSVFDGFRILPFSGKISTPFVSTIELQAALDAFDGEEEN